MPRALCRRESEGMNLDSLSEMFIEELKDVYGAERQLLKEMPKIGKAAFS